MKHYGLSLSEGSELTNITIPSGTSFPGNDNVGELFFRSDENKIYIRNNTTWNEITVAGTIDADLLQGQNGAYYLDLVNHTGILDGGSF